jgi:hypothetical protein
MNPDFVINIIRQEIKNGKISDIDPYQLMVNMLALCIFPFAARPMVQGFILKNDAKAFEQFIVKRKTEVADFIIKAITP